jgi:hypothetical protein
MGAKRAWLRGGTTWYFLKVPDVEITITESERCALLALALGVSIFGYCWSRE